MPSSPDDRWPSATEGAPAVAEPAARRRRRREVLAACGATGDVLEELLAYGASPYASAPAAPPPLPLEDEPHVERWRLYVDEARRDGVVPALARRFAQLRFPVREGMSREEAYRRATRRGDGSAAEPYAPGLVLRRPEALELDIHPTMAGRVPVLLVPDRGDFETLVRAFACRNEPEPVPASMGACLVKGLNNWDRIAEHRRRWEAERGGLVLDSDWQEEFRRIAADKKLYQDSFVLLSAGAYSAVSAKDIGLDEESWKAASVAIRREHELTHYFTYRVFGTVRNHLLDELVADFVGLLRGTGEYSADRALLFLGLEAYPHYRPGGRLEVYRGEPPVSDGAFRVLGALAVRAARNLERLAERRRQRLGELGGLAATTYGLLRLGLEGLAADGIEEHLP